MKTTKTRIYALVMALVLLTLAACYNSAAPSESATTPPSSSNILSSDPSSVASSSPSASDDAPSTKSIPISDEEGYKLFSALNEKAYPVLCWYLSDDSDIDIATESTYAPYYKVINFSTIDEMKSATDEVFTSDFADEFFYDHAFIDPSGADTPMYKEIDGELYRNIDQGGFGWPYQPTDEYYIPYQNDKMIIIAVKTLLPGDEIEWNNFLLRNDNGVWKLDTYYDMNPHMNYSDAFPKQKEDEISNAVSSWFCTQDWSDANQLEANALINYYLYTYLSDIKEEYDYEKGYEVSSSELIEGLSSYLNGIEKETLVAVNQNPGANARYDEKTDSFYFDFTFDPAEYMVVNSESKGAVATLEIMVISKGGEVASISFLDLEVNGSEIKYIGNRIGEKFI